MTTTKPTNAYIDRTVIGTRDEVATVLRNVYDAGTLVSMTPPRPVSATDPRLRLRIRLRTAPAGNSGSRTNRPTTLATVAAPRPSSRPASPLRRPASSAAPVALRTTRLSPAPRASSTRRVGLIVGAVITALAGITYAIGYTLSRLTADAVTDAAGTIVGFITVVAIIAACIGGNGRSGKRHCPGCD